MIVLFTIVYMDVDNFKDVNDQIGHSVGDRTLRTVVQYAKMNLRSTDIVARLGGDELAFLLPETSQEAAQIVVAKMQKMLLEEMEANHWPVSFSMEALFCDEPVSTDDQFITSLDQFEGIDER